MSFDSYTPDQLSAFWEGVTAVAAVVTGIVAIFTLLSLQKDSRDRSRPVISAELLPVVLSHGTSELVIQNVGQSVAKDVRVSFDPPITEDMGQTAAFLATRYTHTIPTLGPGRRLSNLYSRWRGDGSADLVDPVPHELTVTVRYKDSRARKYKDEYDLTLETLRNETVSSPSNTDEKGLQRRWAQALEAIARGVHRL